MKARLLPASTGHISARFCSARIGDSVIFINDGVPMNHQQALTPFTTSYATGSSVTHHHSGTERCFSRLEPTFHAVGSPKVMVAGWPRRRAASILQ